MPGPSSLVVFVDDDGDEFPVRVMGEWNSLHDQVLVKKAMEQALELIDRGVFRPNGGLVHQGKIERLHPIEDYE